MVLSSGTYSYNPIRYKHHISSRYNVLHNIIQYFSGCRQIFVVTIIIKRKMPGGGGGKGRKKRSNILSIVARLEKSSSNSVELFDGKTEKRFLQIFRIQ